MPTCPIEAITLKAMVDPRIIRERRVVMMRLVRTAFRGMSQPGRTCVFISFPTRVGTNWESVIHKQVDRRKEDPYLEQTRIAAGMKS